MEPNSLKWVGSPCGLHGPYVFYKAFKFHLEEGKPRILSLGDFFFVRCKPGDPICVAELQLLWEERTTKQLLSSSKLYFLPEDTPQGRTVNHGEDEIVAVSEKVVVKLDNLVKWTVLDDASLWRQGPKAEPQPPKPPTLPSVLRELGNNGQREALHRYRESATAGGGGLSFRDVLREKAELGDDEEGRRVLVLSYPRYCRYRSVVARLRPPSSSSSSSSSSALMEQVVLALGGVAAIGSHARVLYCRDTFDHPTLVHNESVSEEYAPNLKGRPRKKKTLISQRRDSQGPSKDPPSTETAAPAKVRSELRAAVLKPKSSGGKKPAEEEEEEEDEEDDEESAASPAKGEGDEQAFLVSLYKYMKERGTPIERIPYLGFKQINLWTMFQAAEKLGGYELITARRLWKKVYDELGGNPGSTSAATCTRRHYERLLLPYERHLKGEEDRPLPLVKPKRPEGPGVQEGPAGKRPKVAPDHNAPGETESPLKSPRPSPGGGGPDESSATADHAGRERKSEVDEEDEEELQLTVKRETACGEEGEEEEEEEKKAVPGRPTASLRGGEDHWRGYPETWANAGDWPLIVREAPPTAREAAAHVGLAPPAPLQNPPRGAEEEEEEEDCQYGYRAAPPPGGNSSILSPLAKKKLLSQFSGCALAGGYPFAPPPATAVAHGDRHPHAQPGATVSRPSVIQHAQSLGPLGNGRQEVTSDVVRADPPAPPPRPTVGPYPSHRPGFPSFFAGSHHPLLGLYWRGGERVLSGGASSSFAACFAPSARTDRPAKPCHRSPLPDEDPPCGEEPSDDQPTDLSLPKHFPRKPPPCHARHYGQPHPHPNPHPHPPHRDSGLHYHPKACRVPPMAVSTPCEPLDPPPPPPPPPPIPGHCPSGPAGWGPQSRGPEEEETETGPSERRVPGAAMPTHPAGACSPDAEPKDQPGDGFAPGGAGGGSGPLCGPLWGGGAQETCTGLVYPPAPQQRLKGPRAPLLPPLALHSLMVQRHLLALATTTAAGPHLYRLPVGGGATYGDFLRHGLFPMPPLHQPPGFSAPQLPTLHPSTKL